MREKSSKDEDRGNVRQPRSGSWSRGLLCSRGHRTKSRAKTQTQVTQFWGFLICSLSQAGTTLLIHVYPLPRAFSRHWEGGPNMGWLYDLFPKLSLHWAWMRIPSIINPGRRDFPWQNGTCGRPNWTPCLRSTWHKTDRRRPSSARRTGMSWWSKEIVTQAPPFPLLRSWANYALSLGLSSLICQMVRTIIIPTVQGFSKEAVK